MQLIRTLCVVAVLGALTYGAYVTLTGSPPVEPPLDAVNWDSPPHIELPAAAAPAPPQPAASPSGATSSPAPKFDAAGPVGAARLDTPTDAADGTPLKSTITGVRADPTPSNEPPLSYPSTGAPPGPFDSVGSAPLTAAVPAPPATSDATSGPTLPGVSLSAVQDHTAPPVTPAVGTAPPSSSNASLIAQPSIAAASSNKVPFDEIQSLAMTKPAEALEKLSAFFDDPSLSPDESTRVTQMLDYLAGTVVYSREHLLESAYTVQPGEQLEEIAEKYHVTAPLLAKINGLAGPSNLAPGTQLKVIRGPFCALVDKSRRQLSVFLFGGLYAGSFAVGFGQDCPATDGQFIVLEKKLNRTWPGTSLSVASPSHWLDLGNGMGLHTNEDSASLDNDQARGCIRLTPAEAADVYDILSIGSPVIVRP